MGEAKRRRTATQRFAQVRAPFSMKHDENGCLTHICGFELHDKELRRSINESMAKSLVEAFEVQGPSFADCPLEHAAYHEAGHCVVAAAMGRPYEEVMIALVGRDWLGLSKGGASFHLSPGTTPENDLEIVAIIIAGFVSETVSVRDMRLASSLDERVLFDVVCNGIAAKLGIQGAVLNYAVHVAMGRFFEQWKDVLNAIALALIQKKLLKRDELYELLAPVTREPATIITEMLAAARQMSADPRFTAAIKIFENLSDGERKSVKAHLLAEGGLSKKDQRTVSPNAK
jgi:hypothetical protein